MVEHLTDTLNFIKISLKKRREKEVLKKGFKNQSVHCGFFIAIVLNSYLMDSFPNLTEKKGSICDETTEVILA